MKTLALGLSASLLALALGGCNQQQAGGSKDGGSGPAAIAAPNGDWSQAVTQTAEGGMLMGNPNAKVKVVEFASMTCSHCADFANQDKPKLVDQYVKTGNVSFEFRNYVTNAVDITASLIARCAGANPQFFALTDGIFKDQRTILDRLGTVPEAQLAALQSQPPAQQFQQMAQLSGLQEWAAQRGMPSGRSGQCLANQAEIDRLVQMNADASSQFEIAGTPTFVVNNEVVRPEPGQGNWASVEAAIKEAL
jgi:protein-disulfide isomerase